MSIDNIVKEVYAYHNDELIKCQAEMGEYGTIWYNVNLSRYYFSKTNIQLVIPYDHVKEQFKKIKK